jgi:hypothetical protein
LLLLLLLLLLRGRGGGGAQVFEAAPQEVRGVQAKRAAPDYFL